MPYYDMDPRFKFAIPERIEMLSLHTHLVFTPHWTARDYERLGFSSEKIEDIHSFLAQEKFFKKIYENDGYVVYRILFGEPGS
jgi:hypothetical protein